MKAINWGFLAIFALVSVGCSASSKYMKPATVPLDLPVPADRAAVVFMRPSDYGSAIRFRVFDDQKRFLGDALPETYWQVNIEPGQHWFYANGENAGVMSANLEAGERYYVVIRPYMGVWSARVELTGLSPRFDDWGRLAEWLAASKGQAVDSAGGQAELDTHAGEVAEIISDAAEVWAGTDAEWRMRHSLVPDDGTPAAPLQAAAQP